MGKVWGRRERANITNRLLYHAMVEIRYLARNPQTADDPDAALARIAMIADICHGLTGAAKPPPKHTGAPDPYVYRWQVASATQRRWLVGQFESMKVGYQHLIDAAPLPPPAREPVMRPRWGRHGARLPRGLREVNALDTATLRALVLEAAELEQPGRTPPRHTLAHLDSAGPHLVRSSRPGESLFHPLGPGDLRQYRCALRMMDGSRVVGYLRLRTASFDALPPAIGVVRRLWLSATVPAHHERDVYLWTKDHQATDQSCALCLPPPGPATSGEG